MVSEEEYESRMRRLMERFPYMWAKRPGYYAPADAWLPIIEQLCEDVDAELDDSEKARFRWSQIKEKFGELCAYWWAPDLPQEKQHRIEALVGAAEIAANRLGRILKRKRLVAEAVAKKRRATTEA